MSERSRREDEVEADIPVVPGAGVGAQPITPSDNSLFGQEPDPAPDTRGVNEEDVAIDDDDLDIAGSSPEFDHSLRKRSSEGE